MAIEGGEEAGYGHGGPGEGEADDPPAVVLPGELAEPVITPCGDAEGEEKDVAGEIAELQTEDVDADGDELADEECSGSDRDCADEPPEIGWDWSGCARGLRKRHS